MLKTPKKVQGILIKTALKQHLTGGNRDSHNKSGDGKKRLDPGIKAAVNTLFGRPRGRSRPTFRLLEDLGILQGFPPRELVQQLMRRFQGQIGNHGTQVLFADESVIQPVMKTNGQAADGQGVIPAGKRLKDDT